MSTAGAGEGCSGAGHTAEFLANIRLGLFGPSQWCYSSLLLWKPVFQKALVFKSELKPKLVLLLHSWLWVSPGNRRRLQDAGLIPQNPNSGPLPGTATAESAAGFSTDTGRNHESCQVSRKLLERNKNQCQSNTV